MANIKIPQLGSTQSISDNNYLVIDDRLNTLKVTAKQIKDYATSDVKAEIAPDWAENISYTVGDFVNWNGYLKKCLQAHTSSESLTPANGTYWASSKVGDELERINDKESPAGLGNYDLSNFTIESGNKYTCPSDGYAFLSANANERAECRIYTRDGSWTYFNTKDQVNIVYVKKGMSLCANNFTVFRFVKFNY